MPVPLRYFLFIESVTQLVLAVAFFMHTPLAVALWPVPGSTRMTFIFLSSIYAAAGTSTFWALATKNYGALAGIGLDYVAILAPFSVLCFRMASRGGPPALTAMGAVALAGAVGGLALTLYTRRIPLDRSMALPPFVRLSFILFIVSLLTVSVVLILQLPYVIPWTITPELSIAIGSMFLGAALYFLYGLLRPCWANAAGQLAGFLAYDLVLIVPFIARFPRIEPRLLPSLIVYTTFVTFSGGVAIYYLFINESTRLGTRAGTMVG